MWGCIGEGWWFKRSKTEPLTKEEEEQVNMDDASMLALCLKMVKMIWRNIKCGRSLRGEI